MALGTHVEHGYLNPSVIPYFHHLVNDFENRDLLASSRLLLAFFIK